MPGPDRHEFRVEADPDIDVLMRVLNVFAVQGAAPASLRHGQTAQGAWTVIEVVDLAPERAELVALKLAQMPCVRAVQIGRPGADRHSNAEGETADAPPLPLAPRGRGAQPRKGEEEVAAA